jgi:hypothetical protein
MATLDELESLLEENSSFISSLTPSATPSPTMTRAAEPSRISGLGSELLGSLDAGYGANRFEPSTGSLAYEALVPSWKAAGETVEGLASLAKMGASSIYDYATTDTVTRALRKQEEEAKQLEKDALAAQQAGISLEQYRTAKDTERNKEIADMIGSGGSQLAGSLAGGAAGAKAGALGGFALGSFIPVVGTAVGAGVGALGGGLYGAYLGSGTAEVAYQKGKESIANLIEPGSMRESTPMELATRFSEAGTAGLLPEAGGAALKAAGKGAARGAQKLSEALGPSTKTEALARASTYLEPSMPSATVRGRYAGQAGREQTAGMKTTAEVLGTPEAYVAEQGIGLYPYNKTKYGAMIQENAVKSQEFLIDDMEKALQESFDIKKTEAKAAKALKEAEDAKKGIPTQPEIPEPDINIKQLIKSPEITDETIGRLARETRDAAQAKLERDVGFEYAPLDKAEVTSTTGVKTGVYDSLKKVYGTIPGKPDASGVVTEKLSSAIPSEIASFTKEIRSPQLKSYTVEQLQRWQTRARNLTEKFGNDKDAVRALTKIRKVLTDKIKSTDTGAQHWSKATGAARNAWNVMENHKLAKILEGDRLNAGDVYKAIIKDPENFKNFKVMVGEDSAILDAMKAKAFSDVKNVTVAAGEDTAVAAAKKSAWIRKNEDWLKELFDPREMKQLEEFAVRGEAQAVRAAKTNPLAGSATAARSIEAKSGLERVLGKGGQPADEIAAAKEASNKRLKTALMYGGGALGAGYLGGQVGGYGGIPVGMTAAILALRSGEVRSAMGQKLLREAAMDIAMNPKTAGWTAPKLAKALAERRAAQTTRLAGVGEKVGRMTGRALQAGGVVPTEEEKDIAQAVVSRPDDFLEADKLMEDLKRQIEADRQMLTEQGVDVETPKVVSAKRVSTTDDVAQVLAEKPSIIRAIAAVESSNRPDAVSPKGARGVMQLMPGTAEELGVNPDDPIQNIEGGERYFNQQLKTLSDYKMSDSQRELFALASYNWGPGRVKKALETMKKRGVSLTWNNMLDEVYVPTETREYISKVITKKRILEA